MKEALIDTDILSAFFRDNTIVVANVNRYLDEYNHLNISIITYYEILNGLIYKDAGNQLKKFEAFIVINKIIPLSVEAAKLAATIYADLRKNRQTIGHTDTLIAAIAMVNNFQLITNNTAHFNRIDGLEVSNWLTEQ